MFGELNDRGALVELLAQFAELAAQLLELLVGLAADFAERLPHDLGQKIFVFA
jgi:hypothetical protein